MVFSYMNLYEVHKPNFFFRRKYYGYFNIISFRVYTIISVQERRNIIKTIYANIIRLI